jgi:hypothetical protein
MSDSFKQRIEDGLSGKYKGLNNGFDKLNKYIYNTQRKTYTLIGGLSGSAKTTLVNYILLNNIEDADKNNIPIDVFYYSYEIDEETTKANWLSVIIYKKHKIIIPPEKINGLGDNRLSFAEQEYINKELPYLDSLFKRINFRFDANNPTGIRNELYDYAKSVGEFQYESYNSSEGEKKRLIGYKLNEPDRYTLIIMDHLSLMKLERGFSLKENIDKYSEYCIFFRNICGFSFFNLQQFNMGLNSVERSKLKGVDLSPQQNDFKDSTNPYTDSDIAIGLMNPWKMDMKECLGYDLNILKENFRLLKVIKNRKGPDNKGIGVYFNPSGGSFHELPLPNTPEMEDAYKRLRERR